MRLRHEDEACIALRRVCTHSGIRSHGTTWKTRRGIRRRVCLVKQVNPSDQCNCNSRDPAASRDTRRAGVSHLLLLGSEAQVIIHPFTNNGSNEQATSLIPLVCPEVSGHGKYGAMVMAGWLGLLETFSWRID
jgi:hypothetical protein